MIPDRIPKQPRAGIVQDDERVPTNPGSRPSDVPRRGSRVAVAEIAALQRLAGNQATVMRIAAGREPVAAREHGNRTVQRLAIYSRPAARATALPTATAEDFRRQVEAGNPSSALSVVVAAMTARGELNARLLRTSGPGDLWQIRDIGSLGAQVSFRAWFPRPR